MKCLKEKKGITLVALIITIIVLLILAVVAIGAVQNDGIIEYAKNARDEYGKAQENEQVIIDSYLHDLENIKLLPYFGKPYNITIGSDLMSFVFYEDGSALVYSNGVVSGEKAPAGTIIYGDGTVNIGGTIGSLSSDRTQIDLGNGSILVLGELPVDDSEKNEEEVQQIGDKVAYNEGSGKTSTIDSSFVMDDMEWRVLDIEEDGTVELVSTQPTTSKLTLSGEDGWLNAETNLDTLCNDLYANGTGVTARSLKVDDIEKLAGIITEEDKQSLSSDYGSLWRYKYSTTSGRILSSKSTDKGSTWGVWSSRTYTEFKQPGKAKINSSNYQDEEGNQIVIELEDTYYSYKIADKITSTTSDGISIASLITQGSSWLSTCGVDCDYSYADFFVARVGNGYKSSSITYTSNGGTSSPDAAVRPVVTLPATATLTKVDGVWQIEL